MTTKYKMQGWGGQWDWINSNGSKEKKKLIVNNILNQEILYQPLYAEFPQEFPDIPWEPPTKTGLTFCVIHIFKTFEFLSSPWFSCPKTQVVYGYG